MPATTIVSSPSLTITIAIIGLDVYHQSSSSSMMDPVLDVACERAVSSIIIITISTIIVVFVVVRHHKS
jgi:hypothetical protein